TEAGGRRAVERIARGRERPGPALAEGRRSLQRMRIGSELERLAEVMRRLRAPDGCPWDREQDLRSLRPYLVEETFEVLDEMDRVGAGGPWAPLCEELGDLLFQIVFHAQLASEQQAFDLADVARAVADKLERRHPHVFGEASADTADRVLAD